MFYVQEVSEESFNVTMSIKDAAIVVTSTSAPATRCSLMLTSPLMRQDPNTEAPASTAEGGMCVSLCMWSRRGVGAGKTHDTCVSFNSKSRSFQTNCSKSCSKMGQERKFRFDNSILV